MLQHRRATEPVPEGFQKGRILVSYVSHAFGFQDRVHKAFLEPMPTEYHANRTNTEH